MPRLVEPLSFKQPNGAEHTFHSLEELKNFALAERQFWVEVLEKKTSTGRPLSHEARWPLDRLNVLISAIEETQRTSTNLPEVRNQLAATYMNDRDRIPVSNEPDGLAIEAMGETLPLDAFLAAVTFMLKRHGDSRPPLINNQDMWLGMLAAFNYRLGVTPQHADANAKAIEILHVRHSELINSATERQSAFERNMADTLESLRTEASAMVEQANAEHEAVRDSNASALVRLTETLSAQNSEAKAQWDNTHSAFVEQMRLKAPIQYWGEKRVEHRKRAKAWGAIALLYAAIATTAMMLLLDDEYKRLLAMTASTPLGAYIALAARGLIFSVVTFWIGRIFVRMFLSELHLAMDAYERSTMVSAYLALTQDGKIDDKDRALVLAPLFRPTADGWVKDDASTDANVQNLLAALRGK